MLKILSNEEVSKEVEQTYMTKGIELTECKKLHTEGYLGKGIKILVLDTGYGEHEFTKCNVKECKNFTTDGLEDRNGHGSFVIGEIVQIAPEVEIYSGKILNNNGNGTYEAIINGLKWALELNVDIVSMSVGATKGTEELHKVIKELVDKGINIVVSAGNEGDGKGDTIEHSYPASYQEVINVGAINLDMKAAKYSNSNQFVDVCAVGTDVVSTYFKDNKWCSDTGTSMSCPIVAGFLALLQCKFQDEWKRKPSEIELYGQLIKNTKNLGLERYQQGNGMIVYRGDM